MKKLFVYYNKGEGAVTPTQGYEDDYCVDLYSSKGVLVPPLTFESVKVETNLRTAFNPKEAGMKINIRSGTASKTPLILSNGTGIVEGTYRNGLIILVRNTFIDNRLVDFAFTEEGKRIPVKSIPLDVLQDARKFYDKETEKLGYESVTPEVDKMVYKTHVPAGTIYIAKHTRIAQAHFQEKIHPVLKEKDELPKSERGARGLGSSGTKKK